MPHRNTKYLLHLGIMFSLLTSCSSAFGRTSKHVHTYSDLFKEVSATCTEDGSLAHYTCLECGQFFDSRKNEVDESELLIKATGHHYSSTYKFDETYHMLVCDVCGEANENGKTAHVFDKKVLSDAYKVSDETCLTGSTYYYSCVCGAKGEETFENDDALGHSASETWSYNDAEHWHECSNDCGEKLDVGDHVYDQQVTSENYLKESATCEHGNIYFYSCICGVKGENTFDDGLVAEHSGSHYDYLPFTATSNGTSQFWECDICHQIKTLENGLFSIEKVRYSDSKTLQIELPSLINIGKNFLAQDEGFNILQDGSTQQGGWFGYVTSDNNESTISVNFNNESNVGDKYLLLKNSLITDINGNKYKLDKDYAFAYGSSGWVMETEPTIPAGVWVEKGVAPSVSEDDFRCIMYTFDLLDASLGYTDKSHVQESIDLELSADDGVVLDTSGLVVKRNDVDITIGAQYFQSHILSFNLGFDDAEAGDILTIAKDSVIKLQLGDNTISRKIKNDIAYVYNGTGQWRRAKIVEFGLPSSTHVQWGMALLQDENYFGVSVDTNCFYTGSVKFNGVEYGGLPQGATLGLYFNGLTIEPGFTMNIAKGTYFDCNYVLIITMQEYSVSWDGSKWSYVE